MDAESSRFLEMKRSLEKMQRCVTESLQKCDNLQEDMIDSPRSELSKAKLRILELEDENRNLRLLLESVGSAGMTESLQSNIDRHLMKAKLENEELQKRIKELEEDIQFLKQQISIFKDDFEMERKDREIAHGKITELQKQIKLLNERNSATEASHRIPHIPHTFRHQNRYRGFDVCDGSQDVTDAFSPKTKPFISDEVKHFRSTSPAKTTASEDIFAESELVDLRGDDDILDFTLTGRGVDFRTPYGTDWRQHCSEMLPNRSDNSSQRSLVAASSRGVSRSSFIRQDSDESAMTLSCPKCKRRFLTEDHMELIDHLELCN